MRPPCTHSISDAEMNSLVGRRQGMDGCYLLLVGIYAYVYLFLGSTLKSLKWLVSKWHHHRCMWPLFVGTTLSPLHIYIHIYTFSLASCILATSIYSCCHRQFIHFFFLFVDYSPMMTGKMTSVSVYHLSTNVRPKFGDAFYFIWFLKRIMFFFSSHG